MGINMIDCLTKVSFLSCLTLFSDPELVFSFLVGRHVETRFLRQGYGAFIRVGVLGIASVFYE